MDRHKKTKIVVAMSGGVDSSAAAFLLREKYDVTGMFMRLGMGDTEAAERAARAVARKLGISFYPVNFADEFRQIVVEYFLRSYEQGVTPNPCIHCNRLIKFGVFLERAREMGAEFLATGHYVRIKKLEVRSKKCENGIVKYKVESRKYKAESSKDEEEGRKDGGRVGCKLLRGVDQGKDQSYFLYKLTQDQLARVLFPLGGMEKSEVRGIADSAGLPYLTKESQDVCFLQDQGKILEHNEFLKKHIKLVPGPIKTLDGKTLGDHQGLPLYTIGQRRGVEIGGTGPYYVARADYATNTLYVVGNSDDPALYSSECILREVNWISGRAPEMPLECEAVIRYRHAAVACRVESRKYKVESRKSDIEGCIVVFEEPQRAVTAGQSVVFYLGDEVVGGGIIE